MTDAIALPLDLPELAAELPDGALLRRTVHPSGLRILTERVPGAASASIGWWVPVGSRDEAAHQYGSTHFLEHLLFKGTRARTAYDIAIAFDRVGGEHNAATAREHTVYHAKVRDADLPMAIEVLADMIAASVIDRDEFETERGVILEELAMADDDPIDVLFERFTGQVFPGHALGRPIGGTPDTIRAATRDDVWDHYRAHYRPEELVVTIAGAVDHDEAVARIDAALRAAGWDLDRAGAPAPRRDESPAELPLPQPLLEIDRPLEQVNLVLGARGLASGDPDRHAHAVLHRVLGGGMSSRLFQEVRERRGLAYSVYSFAGGYSDLGMVGISAGCAPQKTAEVIRVCRDEVAKMLDEGVTEAELADAKGAAAGASALSLEDSDARMQRLGRSEVHRGEFLDLEASLARMNAVGRDDVVAVGRRVFGQPLIAATIGRLPEDARALLSEQG